MKVLEIYTYDKEQLEKSKFATVNTKDDIKYITENTIADLFLANTTNNVGFVSFVNNITAKPDIAFTTSIGTIITPIGKLVFNFNYIIKAESDLIISAPFDNELLTAEPTYKGVGYAGFNNLKISVQILNRLGNRVVAIEYDNLLPDLL
jgi:hypothetical protein